MLAAEPTIRQSTFRGGVTSVSAELVRLIIQFCVLAVLARLLDPKDFGLFAMASVLTGLAAMFTDFGLSTATIQRKTITPGIISGLFYLNLGIGGVATIAVLVLAPFVATLFGEQIVANVACVLAISILIVAAGRQHAALLRRDLRWVTSELILVAALVCGAIAAILGAIFFDVKVWALVAQVLVTSGSELAILWIVVAWKPGRVGDWQEVRSSLRFGINLTIFSLLNFTHRQSDDVMIGWRWGEAELGYYSRAYLLLSIPLQIFRGPLTAVFIPTLSKLQHDDDAWAGLYCSALYASLLIATPVSFLLILFAPEVIHILMGEGWEQTTDIFRILSVSIVAQLIMSSTGWLWITRDQTREMMQWALLSVPIMVAGMVIGLPFGAEGVATGYALTFCLLTPLCSWVASRTLPIGFLQIIRTVIPPLFSGGVAYAFVKLAPDLWAALGNGWVTFVGFIIVYFSVSLATDWPTAKRAFNTAKDAITPSHVSDKIDG